LSLTVCIYREIAAAQEGLRGLSSPDLSSYIVLIHSPALLARVQGVEKEVDKLASGNETLQMYIDNLTVQMAKRR
jgi:hypothetical protein